MGNWNRAPKSTHVGRLIIDGQHRLVIDSFTAACLLWRQINSQDLCSWSPIRTQILLRVA
jgi:hypothetical protein